MNRLSRRLVLGLVSLGLVGLLAGCGMEEAIGYVDMQKVTTQSIRAQQLEQQVAQREKDVIKKLDEAQQKQSKEEFEKTVGQTQQELLIFRQAMHKELENAVKASVADVAREKKLTVVVHRDAIPSGGTDITDAVLEKMNATTEGAK